MTNVCLVIANERKLTIKAQKKSSESQANRYFSYEYFMSISSIFVGSATISFIASEFST